MPENFVFEKQKTKHLKDVVYESMLEAIESGKLPPGTRLTEMELAQEMEISRGPVRQALKRLIIDGYVYQHPGIGLIVTDMNEEEREAVFVPIRRTIECYAASCAAKSFTADDYAVAESLLANLSAACEKKDIAEICACDYQFHNFIVSRCASMMLLSIWESVSARIKIRIHEWSMSLSDFNDVVSEHEEQLAAIRCGDEALIQQIFQKYIF